jgi:hypothetical protein
MSLGPGDVACARVCTCMCIGRGSNAKREVSWVECVSIVVQCNAMCSRVSGLVRVWAQVGVFSFIVNLIRFCFVESKGADRLYYIPNQVFFGIKKPGGRRT